MDALCKYLKIGLFKSQILLDTVVLRLIRFPQKVLMDKTSVRTILP